MSIEQNQIEFAAKLIGYIDSGEKSIFLDTVNTENQVTAEFFNDDEAIGVFYSCLAYGGLRNHITFEKESSEVNQIIADLILSSLEKSGLSSCMIWIRNENRATIEYLKSSFQTKPDGEQYYASIEFIMHRRNFSKTMDYSIITIKPFEEQRLDEYLLLLDESMTFASPPPEFQKNREYYLNYFKEFRTKQSFEAFWAGDRLIGLYWRNHAEIEIMAVAADSQRKGYGSMILTHAVEMVFENTDAEYAYLYAVDWNIKGQSFYKKYGMMQNAHSYLLRLINTCD